MEAKELRLGNLVYDTKGNVNTIDLEALAYISKEPHHQVKPIPLTEEWLLKFGFIDKKDFWTIDDVISFSKDFRTTYILTDNTIDNVTHVHKLQNLYFALTQEELTIKS